MKNDILEIFGQKRGDFSKSQRRIADYISERYDKAAFMTAGQLAYAVSTSESTVVRFARDLGYDGYPAMQKAIQEAMLGRLTPSQRIGIANDTMATEDIISAVLQRDIERLRQTGDTVCRKEFAAAVDAILQAKSIYLIGVGSSAMLAEFAGHYLRYMYPNIHVITTSDVVAMFERMMNLDVEDVVIAFSFPRYNSSAIKAVQYCRNTGATVIGVTNSSSPLVPYCDYSLIAKSDMVSFVDSLVAPLSLINALLVSVSSARGDDVKDMFSKLEEIWLKYNVYEECGESYVL